MIANDAREFLHHLLEVNSARVQNDVLNRIQESRDRLEVEIRKLLHEISRIAEQALDRARKVKEEGDPRRAVGNRAAQPSWNGMFRQSSHPVQLSQ